MPPRSSHPSNEAAQAPSTTVPEQEPGNDQLPVVPNESLTRPYIEIRPTDTPVDPDTIARGMDVLLTDLQDASQTDLRHMLTGSVKRPRFEWLLIIDGRSDAQIRYLVGSEYIDFFPDIGHVLRTALPNSYELREVDWHPRHVHELLPVVPNNDCHPHPAITPAHPYVAGVE